MIEAVEHAMATGAEMRSTFLVWLRRDAATFQGEGISFTRPYNMILVISHKNQAKPTAPLASEASDSKSSPDSDRCLTHRSYLA